MKSILLSVLVALSVMAPIPVKAQSYNSRCEHQALLSSIGIAGRLNESSQILNELSKYDIDNFKKLPNKQKNEVKRLLRSAITLELQLISELEAIQPCSSSYNWARKTISSSISSYRTYQEWLIEFGG